MPSNHQRLGGGQAPADRRRLEDRLRRAVRQVLKTYTISPTKADGDRCEFTVVNGRSKYTVVVSQRWQHPPSCSCPDMQRVGDAAGHGHCKHAIAVLLRSDEHRHQLIDLLL